MGYMYSCKLHYWVDGKGWVTSEQLIPTLKSFYLPSDMTTISSFGVSDTRTYDFL